MKGLIEALRNKKTYGVAAIIILIGITEGILGWDIPGVVVENPLTWILNGLGLGSVRAGIAKAQPQE